MHIRNIVKSVMKASQGSDFLLNENKSVLESQEVKLTVEPNESPFHCEYVLFRRIQLQSVVRLYIVKVV